MTVANADHQDWAEDMTMKPAETCLCICVYIYIYMYTHSLIKNNNKRTCPKPGILMQTPMHTIDTGDMNHQHLASGFAGNAQQGMAQAALLQLFYSRGMGLVQKGKPSGLIPSNLVIY